MKHGLMLAGLFISLTVFSQNQRKADSIRQLLETEKLSRGDVMESYYWLSAYSVSPDDELKYGEELFEIAKSYNSQEYLIKGNQRIGVAHRLMGNLGQALTHLFEAAEAAASHEGFESLLADVYAEISTSYTKNGDSENAMLYGAKTIEILRKTDRTKELALNLLNMGYDYYLLGEYDSAMRYYNESEAILAEMGPSVGLSYNIGNRALVFWKLGDHERAKEDLFRAIEMLQPFGDPYGAADYYNQLGNIYLEENDYTQVIHYTKMAMELARKEGLKEQARDASYLLFQAYKNTGQPGKALDHQTQYYAYRDSLQNLETTQELANLRTRFEVGQKQAEVDLLLEQRKGNQLIMIAGGALLLIVIGVALLIYSYSKAKNKLNKQLEEQKNALITLNNTKDKFFSIISHDLRGPANILGGLLGVMKRDMEVTEPDELSEMLDTMETSVERLVKLLDNLLHWAVQQSGQFPHIPEKLSLKSILSEVTFMFNAMASAKGITLDMQLEEDFSVFIDKNTTSTIFRNLLNNAIKFTPEGGRVQVVAKKNTEFGIVKVIDNGIGIPRENLDILFNLDENVTTKGTAGETGMGLGLQLVDDFIAFNKGKIDVESDEGMGTTFIVSLPLHPR